MNLNTSYFPDLGFGLGLRIPYYQYIFDHSPQIDWFEIISENFMETEGRAKKNLARIRERYQVVMHGIALSIGTVDPINSDYLRKLKTLIDFVKPAWVSDHLCWTGVAHKNSHDLLPVPYTEEALKHIIKRIKQVQDYLERPIALENPSTYLEFKESTIPEAEFIATMAQESGCHILLDVNNVYVTCYNHRLDPKAYIDSLPLDKVAQIHLAGHSNYGTHIVDTHDDHVIDEVWALYKYAIHKAGRVINTMIEWDDRIPEWNVLYNELQKAKAAAVDSKNYAPLPDLLAYTYNININTQITLTDAQLLMQDAILCGDGFDAKPESWIVTKEKFAPKDQLAVYINAYRYRLYDVTTEDYPVLKYYLGDKKFHNLIWDFVNNVESTHFNIGKYPAQLPEFLSKHQICDKFAYELSLLEDAVSQLCDADETISLNATHLEGMTAERLMCIVLQPRAALRLFEFQNQVNAYYISVKEDNALPSIINEESFIAIFRHEDVVWRMDLESNEYKLLCKLFAGFSVGEALDELQEELNISEDDLSANLSEWFARWMRNGLLRYEYQDEKEKRRVV